MDIKPNIAIGENAKVVKDENYYKLHKMMAKEMYENAFYLPDKDKKEYKKLLGIPIDDNSGRDEKKLFNKQRSEFLKEMNSATTKDKKAFVQYKLNRLNYLRRMQSKNPFGKLMNFIARTMNRDYVLWGKI